MRSIGNGPQATLVIERYRKSPLVQAFLADVVDEVQRLHPGFSVVRESLHPGDTMGEAVLRGTVDAGIVACTTDQQAVCPVGESDGFGICELPSCQERIFFALPKSNPLAQKPSLRLSDLADCGFVFPLNPEFGRCQPDIAKLFEARGFTMKSRPHELEGIVVEKRRVHTGGLLPSESESRPYPMQRPHHHHTIHPVSTGRHQSRSSGIS